MTPDDPSSRTSARSGRRQFQAAYHVLEDAIRGHAFPGCAFGVLSDGEISLADALGHFTYELDAPAVTPQTAFDVASLTKVVSTTAAAMLLHHRGQLDLDQPLGDLLPGFVVGRTRGDKARHVKIRHLLAHSSGLPGYVEFFRTFHTPAALYRACLELPLEAEPGSRAEYSDPGFILLGKALELAMGDQLDAWVSREILRPVGMTATQYCPREWLRATIPPSEDDLGFRHRRIQGEVQDENAWVLGGVAGHAGLFSNVPDLLRFVGRLLPSGDAQPRGSERPLLFHPETVASFARRQGPEGSSRALGWDTPSEKSSSGSYFSPHSIGHLGFSGCSIWIDLDARLAVVLLTNRTWPDRSSQQIRSVRPAFHDAIREALDSIVTV